MVCRVMCFVHCLLFADLLGSVCCVVIAVSSLLVC